MKKPLEMLFRGSTRVGFAYFPQGYTQAQGVPPVHFRIFVDVTVFNKVDGAFCDKKQVMVGNCCYIELCLKSDGASISNCEKHR